MLRRASGGRGKRVLAFMLGCLHKDEAQPIRPCPSSPDVSGACACARDSADRARIRGFEHAETAEMP
eukprot:4464128-Pleurochrysis_carterae.AAC.1